MTLWLLRLYDAVRLYYRYPMRWRAAWEQAKEMRP